MSEGSKIENAGGISEGAWRLLQKISYVGGPVKQKTLPQAFLPILKSKGFIAEIARMQNPGPLK